MSKLSKAPDLTLQSSAARSRFRRRLLAWFDQHQRDLPWRRQKSWYRTWVSEIMLQQTQVSTVVDYFQRFMKRFPNVHRLANAERSQVLKSWEGLGYYRRARSLHDAAKRIVTDYAGEFPVSLWQAQELPGIGRYTAAAILSIAYDQPLAIVEGNTQRVYSRLFAFEQDPRSPAGQKAMWAIGQQLVSRHRAGDLNQALMELGSEVCKVATPECGACPVRQDCAAAQLGIAQLLPVKSVPGQAYEHVREAVLVIARRGRVLMRQCKPDERWAGLWDFPRYGVPGSRAVNFLSRKAQEQSGLTLKIGRCRKQIRHCVTRFRITLECYICQDVSGRTKTGSGFRWMQLGELTDLPMSVTAREIADWYKDSFCE